MANRKRILIADDDPDLLDLLKMDLSYQGYEILTAANGKDALQAATTQQPDLVLLDVMMPYIDGYHVASEVSNKLGMRAPKILIMTSRDTVREKGIALLSGAIQMIQKPFTMQQLHLTISQILEKSS